MNLGDIAAHFTDAGATVDVAQLQAAGLVPRSAKYVKILGTMREGRASSSSFLFTFTSFQPRLASSWKI